MDLHETLNVPFCLFYRITVVYWTVSLDGTVRLACGPEWKELPMIQTLTNHLLNLKPCPCFQMMENLTHQ